MGKEYLHPRNFIQKQIENDCQKINQGYWVRQVTKTILEISGPPVNPH
jgi:hypothetical protein